MAAAPDQAPTRQIPAKIAADVAIKNGVDGFCGWFFGGSQYSIEGLRQAAFDAGYGRGSPVEFFPLPEMLQEPSFSAMGFTAVTTGMEAEAGGVAAFVSFHNPICQIQVYGYRAEADAALTSLQAAGWRMSGTPVVGKELNAQRYLFGTSDTGMTMVVSRSKAAGEGLALTMIINVIPGHDRTRGIFD